MADYLKLPELARRLDVSEKTARRMVRAGTLPAVFIGGAYRVSEEDLAEYLRRAKVELGKVTAPPAMQESFNGLLEEERRTEYLRAYRDEVQATAAYARGILKTVPSFADATGQNAKPEFMLSMWNGHVN